MPMLLAKVKQRLKWRYLDLCFALGQENRMLRPRAGKRIVLGHGVVPDRMQVRMARFDDARRFGQLAALIAKHAVPSPLADLFAPGNAGARMQIALCFDDGHRSIMDVALPILERHQIPATIYCTAAPLLDLPILWTDLLDLLFHTDPQVPARWAQERGLPPLRDALFFHLCQAGPDGIRAFVADLAPQAAFMRDPRWDLHWKLLGHAEMQALARHPLITIGSHSLLHADLSALPLAAAEQDCVEAKRLLEACIGQEVPDFAFPFGRLQPGLPEALARLGHARLAADGFDPQHRHGLVAERFSLNPFVSARVQMRQILRGSYD